MAQTRNRIVVLVVGAAALSTVGSGSAQAPAAGDVATIVKAGSPAPSASTPDDRRAPGRTGRL
jgi:hypothetical protein